ncbi:MAG TPA: hypothetical protein VES01_02140 [Dermatophilaceae bacterium]|nr:hypothetical protein [Dermatophilaceae bacterium]
MPPTQARPANPVTVPAQTFPPVLEIRVHGVANTPPETTLGLTDSSQVDRVAGDDTTGLYRAKNSDPTALVETQAYSWGQLTSGQRAAKDLRRALWLLLLPFALVNVAFWARPEFPDKGGPSKTGGLASYLARVIALTLTVSLLLTATTVGVDLVGWQWAAVPRLDPPWLAFLTRGWFAGGSRVLLVGLAAPVAALAIIYLASRRTFRYEAVESLTPADAGTAPDTGAPSLRGRGFWSGDRQVRELSSVHWRVGMVASLASTVGPVALAQPRDHPSWWSGVILCVAFAVVAVIELVRLGGEQVTIRAQSAAGVSRTPLSSASLVVFWAAAAGSIGYLASGLELADRRGTLPGLNGSLRAVFVAQMLLVVVWTVTLRHGPRQGRVCLALCGVGGVAAAVIMLTGLDRLHPGWSASGLAVALVLLLGWAYALPGSPAARGDAAPAQPAAAWVRPAWRGAGGSVLAATGVLLAALYSGGLVFLVSWRLPGGTELALPDSLRWAAAGLPFFVFCVLVVTVWSLSRLQRHMAAEAGEVLGEYGRDGAHAAARAGQVARARLVHLLMAERALGRVGWLGGLALIGVIALAAGSATGSTFEEVAGPLAWVATLGFWLALGMLLGFAALGLIVYRGKPERRLVSIVWDLATFWPRASHPFAPPCYAESCVPQLVTRVCLDTQRKGFILAGHSQGSLICLATTLQLPTQQRGRVVLLTFGTQLSRLYGRVFPALLGPAVLHEAAESMGGHSGLRWRSFYRSTDPLGYPLDVVLQDPDGVTQPVGVDHPGSLPHRPLRDPEGLVPEPRQITDPVMNKHSDYSEDSQYRAYLVSVANRLVGVTDDW